MEVSWDEVLETAQLFSKLPKASRIREHVKWVRDNGILSLDKLRSKDIFRSITTLDRVIDGKSPLRYENLCVFYEEILRGHRPSLPKAWEEIDKERPEEVKREFLDITRRYSDFYRKQEFPREVCRRMLKKVNLNKQMMVLDVATGPAANAATEVAPYVNKVFAIDISKDALNSASHRLKEMGIDNVELLEMSMEEMRRDWNEYFDLVLLNLAPITEKGLKEVARVLKPDGIVAFSHFGEGSFREIYDAVRKAVNVLGLQDKYIGPRPPLTIGAIDKIFRRNELKVKISWIDEEFKEYGEFENAREAMLFAELFVPITNLLPFKERLHWLELNNLMNETEKMLKEGKVKITLNIVFAVAEKT
jgi:ubiquinone/menaquinone biosynthesis C-methylase UbiE